MPVSFLAVDYSDCFSKFVVSPLDTENIFQIGIPFTGYI